MIPLPRFLALSLYRQFPPFLGSPPCQGPLRSSNCVAGLRSGKANLGLAWLRYVHAFLPLPFFVKWVKGGIRFWLMVERLAARTLLCSDFSPFLAGGVLIPPIGAVSVHQSQGMLQIVWISPPIPRDRMFPFRTGVTPCCLYRDKTSSWYLPFEGGPSLIPFSIPRCRLRAFSFS